MKYGVEIVYRTEQWKRSAERRNELARRFKIHQDSLTLDQIEESMRKTVWVLYPHISKDEAEACVAQEMNLVTANPGGFSAYMEEDNGIQRCLAVHIPLPPGLCSSADGPDVSDGPDDVNRDHPTSE